MKIGLVCDSHISGGEKSPQKAYFNKCVDLMKKDGVKTVFHLGDVTAFGDIEVFSDCEAICNNFNAYFLLGNAEMRNKDNKYWFSNKAKDVKVLIDNRTFLGLNTTSNTLSNEQFLEIEKLKEKDVVLTHFGLHSLDDKSKERLEKILLEKELIYIHAHSHKWFDYKVNKSRVVGLRALDPDKSIGDYPCVTYFDTETSEFTERIFKEKKETLIELSKFLGFSISKIKEDLVFAIESGVNAVELKLSNTETDFDNEIENLTVKYKEKVGGYISVHMPNIKYNGESFIGKQDFLKGIEIAKRINANGITVHPPKIKKSLLLGDDKLFNEIITFYVDAFLTLNKDIKIGFENIHKTKSENGLDVNDLGFGYIPEDIILLSNEVNKRLNENRIGLVLDVGHTKNNGSLSSIYTVGRWLEMTGDKTVAYHIHQVIKTEDGLKNHKAIENWFGPLVSYASFFYAFGENLINHAPIFIEVRGKDNYLKSIEAFNKLI